MLSKPTTAAEIEAKYGMVAGAANLPPSVRAFYRAAYAVDVLKVREQPAGSNRGPDVDRYLAAAGMAPGNPWCAAFATCMLLDSGVARSELPANSASVHGWLEWATANGYLTQAPVRGDVGLIIESPTTGHLVIVSRSAGHHVQTLEGNTNPGGSREGFGAFRRVRPASEFRCFVGLGELR